MLFHYWPLFFPQSVVYNGASTVPQEIWRALYAFGLNDQPNHPTFLAEHTILRRKGSEWPQVVTPQKREEVKQAVIANSRVSIRRLAPRVELSRAATHHLLRKLNFKPYRLSVCQELKAGNYRRRIAYCPWLERLAHRGASRFDNVFFSDKAWVHLDGYINSQNYRLWCCENPHAFVESGLHSLKIGIWCGISRRKIIGPIFFEQCINAER